MPIDLIYPTPIYHSFVENHDNISDEISEAISSIEFITNEEWYSPHQISDPSFSENILEKLEMKHLSAEIKNNIGKYLNDIQFYNSQNYHGVANYSINSSWFSKYEYGEYAPLHTHAHHEIAGVYYHKVEESHGNFYFECPTSQMQSSFIFNHMSHTTRITPSPGLLLLFPGYLYHGVYANRTQNERISISFNVSFQKPYFSQ